MTLSLAYPDEIVLAILLRVPPRDLVENVSLASRRLFALARAVLGSDGRLGADLTVSVVPHRLLAGWARAEWLPALVPACADRPAAVTATVRVLDADFGRRSLAEEAEEAAGRLARRFAFSRPRRLLLGLRQDAGIVPRLSHILAPPAACPTSLRIGWPVARAFFAMGAQFAGVKVIHIDGSAGPQDMWEVTGDRWGRGMGLFPSLQHLRLDDNGLGAAGNRYTTGAVAVFARALAGPASMLQRVTGLMHTEGGGSLSVLAAALPRLTELRELRARDVTAGDSSTSSAAFAGVSTLRLTGRFWESAGGSPDVLSRALGRWFPHLRNLELVSEAWPGEGTWSGTPAETWGLFVVGVPTLRRVDFLGDWRPICEPGPVQDRRMQRVGTVAERSDRDAFAKGLAAWLKGFAPGRAIKVYVDDDGGLPDI